MIGVLARLQSSITSQQYHKLMPQDVLGNEVIHRSNPSATLVLDE